MPFDPQSLISMPFDIEFHNGTASFKYGKLEPEEKLAHATIVQGSAGDLGTMLMNSKFDMSQLDTKLETKMDEMVAELAEHLKVNLEGKKVSKETIDKAEEVVKEALIHIIGEVPGADETIDAVFDGDEPPESGTLPKTPVHAVVGDLKEDGAFSLKEKDIEGIVVHDQIVSVEQVEQGEKPNKNYDIVPEYWAISMGKPPQPVDKSALKYGLYGSTSSGMEALLESKKMQSVYKEFAHHFGAAVLPPSSEVKIREMMESVGVNEYAGDFALYHACLSVMSRSQIMKLFLMAFPEAKSVDALKKMIWSATGDKWFMGIDWNIEFKSESMPGARLLDVEGADGEGEAGEEEDPESGGSEPG
jgi:hypothetical protein